MSSQSILCYIISKLEKQSPLISPECVYTCQWTGSALFQITTCQAITWTNTELLSIGPLGTNFCEIWNKIQKFYWWKCISKYCAWKDLQWKWCKLNALQALPAFNKMNVVPFRSSCCTAHLFRRKQMKTDMCGMWSFDSIVRFLMILICFSGSLLTCALVCKSWGVLTSKSV